MADGTDKLSTVDLLKEDAVSFLTKISWKYDNVLALLNANQAKLLSKNPSEPYQPEDVNHEYLSDMSCYYSVKQRSDNAKVALSKALLTPRIKIKQVDVEGSQLIQQTMEEVSIIFIVCFLKLNDLF